MRCRIWHHIASIKNTCSSQENAPRKSTNHTWSSLNTGYDQETIDQLMSLKKTSRDVDEDEWCDRIQHNLDSLFNDVCFLRVFDGNVEKFLHIVERVLIHRVDSCKIGNYKVKYWSSLTDCFVGVSGHRVVLFYLGCRFELDFDVTCWVLTVFKYIDESVRV